MYIEDLGVKALKGRQIIRASVNEAKDLVVIQTTTGNLFLSWQGSCCAHCYLVHIDGSEALCEGAIVLSAENTEWSDILHTDDETIETMGTKIRTDKGLCSFESRVEHNGYYGGDILVSDYQPMDQYHGPINDWLSDKYVPLTDF